MINDFFFTKIYFCPYSFVVTNGDSSRIGSLHFSIEHGDRIPPTLQHNTGLRLLDGSTATITADHLQLADPDTATTNLSFVITQPPHHGRLLLRGVPLSPPLAFTQTDIDELNLAYRHDPGSLADTDRFYFLPTDRSNRGFLEFGQLREEATIFNIQVSSSTTPPLSLVAPSGRSCYHMVNIHFSFIL